MLQQTQVETVIPYYTRWLKEFPDIKTLARSNEESVLLTWEGLGYYARVRNLLKTAQIVVDQMDGAIPDDRKLLSSLPGIGRSTAGAILSIAFSQNEPILDGNLKRVFSRLFNIVEPVGSKEGEKLLWMRVGEFLPEGNAGNFNQAMMDLGALVCLPKKPTCQVCPVLDLCEAKNLGVELERPTPKVKKTLPMRTFYCFIIQSVNTFLLIKRKSRGLLGGLWEFPNMQGNRSEISLKILATFIEEQFGIKVTELQYLHTIRHVFTHFKSVNLVYECHTHGDLKNNEDGLWIQSSRMHEYPMGKVARKISTLLDSRKPDARK